jgi:hypothetical protein
MDVAPIYEDGSVTQRNSLEDGEAGLVGTGMHLVWWVDKAMRQCSHSLSWNELAEKAKDLLKLYATLKSTVDIPKFSSEQQLIADLDLLSFSERRKICGQLLHLLKHCFPNTLGIVIGCCAKSKNIETRKAGLVFSKDSDELMDAWVDGTDFQADLFPKGNDLVADPDSGPFVDELAFALLRNGVSKERLAASAKIIETILMPFLTSSARVVFELIMAKMNETSFLENYRRKEYAYATRAGYKFDSEKVFSVCTRMKLASPDIWWLISAMPPTVKSIAKILSLDMKSRAIFGLCTSAEWKQLSENPQLFDDVDICRRTRRLTFST